jgi:gamma-glutamyltranspeptidase/glutathione hydrolase
MRCLRVTAALLLAAATARPTFSASAQPARARHGMVVSVSALASQVGADALEAGGNAVDAALAVAFALAVTHPAAGNIGGGGFLLYRPASGEPVAYDFRETAPGGSSPTMFLTNGTYDADKHHESHLAAGVPGTVAGLHMAWREHGTLPWRRLVEPAIALARDGFVVSDGLARDLKRVLPQMRKHPATLAQFTREGTPYEMGDRLRQPDLARTLERIAAEGPPGFYQGETARLIEREMKENGGLITLADLASYRPLRREPLRGSYRGYEVLGMPPVSSGGTLVIEMLNILEGFDLGASGFGAASTVHRVAEAMRRAYADRARHLGDPEFNPRMPLRRLLSKEYAAELRATMKAERASVSAPDRFEWPRESPQTTHVSAVDAARNAVSLTYTLEDSYGAKIVVPGAGFLLNNEMGDFNAGPGLTDAQGLIGTEPNLAAPGKRMLSSMAPTILAREGKVFLTLGSPGGRRIPNAVLLTILNVVDFGMNVQEAVDALRYHHQWLPDRILHEPRAFSPDTAQLLRARGHELDDGWSKDSSTWVGAVLLNASEDLLEGGCDRRSADAAAAGH